MTVAITCGGGDRTTNCPECGRLVETSVNDRCWWCAVHRGVTVDV